MTMKIVGIAGASGTGKSTLAAHLVKTRGAVLVDGDAVAHEILDTDRDVIAAVVALVGPEVLDEEGRIDRRRLGPVVFGDKEKLRSYNAIIHPAIRRRCGRLVDDARAAGAPIAVVDAALLLERKMPFAYDLLVALTTTQEIQIARIMAKGGWSEAEVRRRLENQAQIEKSLHKADAVIDTSGEISDVLARIDELVDALSDNGGGNEGNR